MTIDIGIVANDSGTRLRIEVDDNGKGIELQSRGAGFGLIGMRERIQALNGVFSYEISNGEGFRIFIHIPHNGDNVIQESNP